MTRNAAMYALSILMLATAGARAQERPDFSGTWTAAIDPPQGTTAKPAPPVYGQQFSVTHQGQALTVTRTMQGMPATIAYVLDGSETTSRMPGRLCEPDFSATWTASWDQSAIALTMTGAVPPNGKPVKMDVKSTMRLESPDTLRVEMTSRAAGQAAPRTSTTLYRRSGPPSAAPAPAAKARGTIAQLAWLSGVWIGTRGTTTFEERWTPSAAGSMMAISRTLRDGAMSEFEFLCIVERDGGLVYQAMPNGRMPATDFTLTKIDGESAVFENPSHDFPKMIRYTKQPDGSLEAVVSGDAGSKPLTFLFKREQ